MRSWRAWIGISEQHLLLWIIEISRAGFTVIIKAHRLYALHVYLFPWCLFCLTGHISRLLMLQQPPVHLLIYLIMFARLICSQRALQCLTCNFKQPYFHYTTKWLNWTCSTQNLVIKKKPLQKPHEHWVISSLSPSDCWGRLQQSCDPERGRTGPWLMDGWMDGCR